MKKSIHPTYYSKAQIRCLSCGTVHVFGSTVESMTINICSNCHPFYTGQQVFVDSASKISKFESKVSKSTEIQKRIEEMQKNKEARNKSKVQMVAKVTDANKARLSLRELMAKRASKK